MLGLIRIPVFVWLIGAGAALMLVPAAHASVMNDNETARSFFYAGILALLGMAFVGLATSANPRSGRVRGDLLTLLFSYSVLPFALAVPFAEVVPGLGFGGAVWEMISCITTTGAALLPDGNYPASAHLWRALVGWFGGAIILVSAAAVLEPLRLGGYEVLQGAGSLSSARIGRQGDLQQRVGRASLLVLPAYVILTGVLWLALIMAGDRALPGLIHAMGTLSTSGIGISGGPADALSGLTGEALILAGLLFALSAQLMPRGGRIPRWPALAANSELRLAVFVVLVFTLLLLARHWMVAIELDAGVEPAKLGAAAWGALFSAVSFLTTTGYLPAAWTDAQTWAGLRSPELLLGGLAVFGGGVATTTGGIKLLRLVGMLAHGHRELAASIYPSSVGSGSEAYRRLGAQGTLLAWMFFMLFVLSAALVVLALSLVGIGFDEATVFSIAALTTTGPLGNVPGGIGTSWGQAGAAAQVILAVAMVVGRVETLAIVALLNPDFWRR